MKFKLEILNPVRGLGLNRVKQFLKKYQAEIVLFIGVVLISLISFAMGYIVAKIQEKEPIKIEKLQIPSTKFQKYPNSNDQNSKSFEFVI